MSERVVVAMSGGVDSSVAALRLVRAGLEVVGVTLHLWDYPEGKHGKGRCCAPDDVRDARRVADALGIPHFVFDRRATFDERVVTPFVDGYLRGVTPSPCVACNAGPKLGELFELASRLGAVAVATGHYARVLVTAAGPRLARGLDPAKDQSYFLHRVPAAALARLRFPLGESTKREVREEAARANLPGADKPDSVELCFVPDGSYAEFVESRAPDRVRPGALVSDEGRVLGGHPGVHRFTVGQRRHLGVAGSERSYVTRIDGASGRVEVGRRERLRTGAAKLADLVLAPGVSLPLSCAAQVRYRARPLPARVEAAPGGAVLRFSEPLEGGAVPGQSAVFYEGDQVLGGGTLLGAVAPERAPRVEQPP